MTISGSSRIDTHTHTGGGRRFFIFRDTSGAYAGAHTHISLRDAPIYALFIMATLRAGRSTAHVDADVQKVRHIFAHQQRHFWLVSGGVFLMNSGFCCVIFENNTSLFNYRFNDQTTNRTLHAVAADAHEIHDAGRDRKGRKWRQKHTHTQHLFSPH